MPLIGHLAARAVGWAAPGRGLAGPVSSVPGLRPADTWAQAELSAAPRQGAAPAWGGGGCHTWQWVTYLWPLLTSPNWPAPRLTPSPGKELLTALLCPLGWGAAGGWGRQSNPLFLLRETGSVALTEPLPPPPPPSPGSLDLPRASLPSAAWVALAGTNVALAPGPQRLRALRVSGWRGSRWGPWAELTRAVSSSTWLVLLALTPRAAQGERSC